jgi:hypothetical protein
VERIWSITSEGRYLDILSCKPDEHDMLGVDEEADGEFGRARGFRRMMME